MLDSLSVKSKLTIAFSILTLIVILISLLSLVEISAGKDRFSAYVIGTGQRQETALRLLVAAQARAISARNLMLLTSADSLKAENEALQAAHNDVAQLLSSLQDETNEDAPEEMQQSQKLIAEIAGIEARYGQVVLALVELASRGEKDAGTVKLNNECMPLLAALVKATNAYIDHEIEIGAMSLEAAQSAYSRQRIQVVLVCVFAAAIALVLGYVISRSLITALGAEPALLSAIAQRVASGDLRPINETRSAAAGSVLASLGHMQDSLSSLISEVSQSSAVISKAAEDFSATTHQAQIGVGQQKQEIDQVATAIHEMAATAQEVARNSEGVAHQARVADQQAQEGAKTTHGVIEAIAQLADEISHSVAAMTRLQEESQHIGRVLDVIKSVADQTNLLALNAAIEAARAGEAGRGFAVVADEVRGLAQHTQNATHEIAALIASLQKISQETAGMMQTCRNLADESVTQVTSAGNAVSTITDMIANIQQMMQQIATAAEQQSAVAEEISQSVTRVRDIADQSATTSEQTAASSSTLARLGGNLQEKINHFQV